MRVLALTRYAGRCLAISIFLSPGLSVAAVIHVPADQPTIQAGIDAAAAGDTILVAPGTYAGTGNRDIDLMGKNVLLTSEGGASLTIIDCEGTYEVPHFAFYLHSGESPECVIRGFTIRSGAGRYNPQWQLRVGGAISCEWSASPTIVECVFEQNTVLEAGGMGGAVFCSGYADCTPSFIRCHFAANTAVGAGAMAVLGSASVQVRECHFVGNSAAGGSGAVVAGGRPSVFADCVFDGNTAGTGAGAMSSGSFEGNTIMRCVFRNNHAGLTSWINNEGGALAHGGPGLIQDCVFVGNSCGLGECRGGAIAIAGGSGPLAAQIVNCVISGNYAYRAGGILASGAVEITSCQITDNWWGGLVVGQSCVVTGCTVALNLGSAISGGSATLSRSILAFNTGDGVSGDSPTMNLECCDVYGNVGGDWEWPIADQAGINGNSSEDPLFCEASTGNLHLAPGSPYLDETGCDQVGAFGLGCDVQTSVSAPNFRSSTWGVVKHLFGDSVAVSMPR